MDNVGIIHRSHRRTFLAGLATVLGRAVVDGEESAPHLVTMTQWLKASPNVRKLALQSCLDRIRELEPSIHAWVQILPQNSIGRGSLAEIPFGVKDIVETRGLATDRARVIAAATLGERLDRDQPRHGAMLTGYPVQSTGL